MATDDRVNISILSRKQSAVRFQYEMANEKRTANPEMCCDCVSLPGS